MKWTALGISRRVWVIDFLLDLGVTLASSAHDRKRGRENEMIGMCFLEPDLWRIENGSISRMRVSYQ